MESFAAGWLGQLKEQVEMYGILPVLCYIFSHFGSVIVASSIWFGFEREDVDTNSRLWVGFFGGCVIFLLGLSCTLLSLQKRYSHHYLTNLDRSEPAMSPRLYYIDFCYGSVWALKESLEPVVGPIPTFWCHMMKKIVPQVLLLVWMRHILLAINADSSIGFGKYYGLDVSSPVQILGIVFFAATIALCLLGVIFPQLFAKFVPPPTSQFINRRDTMEDIEDTAVGGSSSESMEELPHMEEPVVLEGGGDDDDAIE